MYYKGENKLNNAVSAYAALPPPNKEHFVGGNRSRLLFPPDTQLNNVH